MARPTVPPPLSIPYESLWDRPAVCRRLKCSKASLQRYEKRGWLKSLKIGPRLVRYRLEDIIAFEERFTRPKEQGDNQ